MENLFNKLNHYLTESKVLESEVFLLSNGKWLLLFLIIFVGFVLQKIIQLAWPTILRFTKRTAIEWDDQLVEASRPYIGRIVAGLFLYAAVRASDFGDKFEHGLTIVARLYISINIILLIYRSVDVLMDVIRTSTRKRDFPIEDQVLSLLHKTIKIFVVVFGFLIMIQNFGINVVSLLAGLGLGGLAFALAAQDTCANFFGSIMILTDKPFKVGDFVKVNSNEGTVEDIGFRSTKMRTPYGSLVTIPNAEMAKANIDNMGARAQHRIRFQLGVEYSTSPEKMKAFVEGIKSIIANNALSDKENFWVGFENYGDFSLNILVNFFVKVDNIKAELIEKEKVLFEIYSLAEKLKIGFAFPTQTLLLQKTESPVKSL